MAAKDDPVIDLMEEEEEEWPEVGAQNPEEAECGILKRLTMCLTICLN